MHPLFPGSAGFIILPAALLHQWPVTYRFLTLISWGSFWLDTNVHTTCEGERTQGSWWTGRSC